MKTISRTQNRRARKGVVQKTILAIVFVVLVGILNHFGFQPLRPVVQFIATPIWKVQELSSLRLSNFTQLLQSKKNLVEKNNELRASLEETAGLRVQVTALLNDNAKLKHLLGRSDERTTKLAAVLSRPGVSPYDTLIIDVGTEDGIHVGDEVVALGDFIVGYVSSVERKRAQVTLFSAPGQKTNILIGEENVEAVATGRGAGNFRAQLSRDAEIKEGDAIVLSSFDVQIFGEVEKILRTETDAFQTILFKSPINVFSIRFVEVVTTSGV